MAIDIIDIAFKVARNSD